MTTTSLACIADLDGSFCPALRFRDGDYLCWVELTCCFSWSAREITPHSMVIMSHDLCHHCHCGGIIMLNIITQFQNFEPNIFSRRFSAWGRSINPEKQIRTKSGTRGRRRPTEAFKAFSCCLGLSHWRFPKSNHSQSIIY